MTVPRYDGAALPAGTEIAGPALIREPTTTIVVYPGCNATVTALGNYRLESTPGSDVRASRPSAEEVLA